MVRCHLHPKRQQRIVAEERGILSLPGGGGFGAPAKRDPTQVARDVADGLVSVERAREVYGVVLMDSDQHAERSADIEASSRLREDAASKEARRG
jgi:N-methylhydantoinase B